VERIVHLRTGCAAFLRKAHWLTSRAFASPALNGGIRSTMRGRQPASAAASRLARESLPSPRWMRISGSTLPCLRSEYASVSTPARYLRTFIRMMS
jgi:hypothetical protein